MFFMREHILLLVFYASNEKNAGTKSCDVCSPGFMSRTHVALSFKGEARSLDNLYYQVRKCYLMVN